MVWLKLTARNVALMASMAALYVVLSELPGFPVVGAERAQIGVISCVVPVFGILLGPWLGGSAAFLGAVSSRVLFGASPFRWLTLPTMALSAFTAGCLSRRRLGPFRGWIGGLLILIGLILTWYLTEIGQSVLAYPALHFAALMSVLIFRGNLADFTQHGEISKLAVGVCLVGFAASMVAQLYGSLAFLAAAQLGFTEVPLSSVFFGLIPVVAVERSVITVIITVLGVPILLALRTEFIRP